MSETTSYIKATANGTVMTIGNQSGWIDYIDVNGQAMLTDRASVVPEFWRAPTDNDYGARLQMKYDVWKSPQTTLREVSHKPTADNGLQVTAKFDMPEVNATLTMTYTLTADGRIVVNEKMSADTAAKVSEMFRYGMQLRMPEHFNRIEYHGRGPIENYVDRNTSQFIIKADTTVASQYYQYIRPQESGNHTDIRHFTVYDGNTGNGLRFYSNAPMECSALNYLTSDLDDGRVKERAIGRHSGDLTPRKETQVHIQQRQMGLGCITSWGTLPLPQYRMPYGNYDFTFVIEPVKVSAR